MTRQRGQSKPRGKTIVEVENVGGIDQTTVEFGPGATVLSGRNATNRSSFLRAIMAALGSDRPALKADADEGSVELTIGEETYTRTFERKTHGIVTGGDPYLDDASEADLFAFLLEDNEARLAVERGDDLRELMLRPVDTEEIESEIERLRAERDEIERQLEELDGLERSLTEFETERERVSDEQDAIRTQLEEIEAPDASIEASREQQDELDALLDELGEERNQLDDARFDLTTERESVEELRDEIGSIDDEIEALEDISEDRLGTLEERIESLRSTRSTLETEISQLGTVSEFNKEMVDRHADLFAEGSDGGPTDALVEDEEVTCWTCGTQVDVDAIDTAIDYLQERRQEKVDEHADVTAELESVRAERTEIQRRRADRERLESERQAIEQEIGSREQRIEALEAETEERETRVAELEEAVAALEHDDHAEILDRQREINELEFELRRLENEYDRLTSNIEQIDAQLDRREELEARQETIGEELVERRTRVERIEQDAVEAFNEHMAELLDVLNYENIERVWIERRTETVRDGRGTAERTVFDHHVVRSADDGTTYEDSVEHLSESEREVIGLVFSLSGYLVHELHEQIPFVLLDSLEVIDSNRIAAIVEYFESYAEYLVVALLPEDAAAIDTDVERVTNLAG